MRAQSLPRCPATFSWFSNIASLLDQREEVAWLPFTPRSLVYPSYERREKLRWDGNFGWKLQPPRQLHDLTAALTDHMYTCSSTIGTRSWLPSRSMHFSFGLSAKLTSAWRHCMSAHDQKVWPSPTGWALCPVVRGASRTASVVRCTSYTVLSTVIIRRRATCQRQLPRSHWPIPLLFSANHTRSTARSGLWVSADRGSGTGRAQCNVNANDKVERSMTPPSGASRVPPRSHLSDCRTCWKLRARCGQIDSTNGLANQTTTRTAEAPLPLELRESGDGGRRTVAKSHRLEGGKRARSSRRRSSSCPTKPGKCSTLSERLHLGSSGLVRGSRSRRHRSSSALARPPADGGGVSILSLRSPP
jgi:hypothetical protein